MQEKENQLSQEISNPISEYISAYPRDNNQGFVSTKEALEELNSEIKNQVIVYTKAFRKAYDIKLNPTKREYPKIGRNDKCPCGSGLKYKNCCIKFDEK